MTALTSKVLLQPLLANSLLMVSSFFDTGKIQAHSSSHLWQASACGETQQSRYEASSVGNRVTDGKADTLATAGTEHAGCEGFLGSHLGVLLYVENSQSSSCNNPHKESTAPNPNNLTEETPKKETDSILSTADLLGWWHLHATGWEVYIQ